MSRISTVRIDGEMTIYRASELKAQLLDALPGATQLEVDLAAVSDIDTVGVQLLLLAQREAAAQNCTLHLAGHSQAVIEAFELLDLAAHFGPVPAAAA